MIKVSIILSISNEVICIECLDSILNQSLKDIEIICNYNQNTASIFENYSKKDKRIRLVPNEVSLTDIRGEYVVNIKGVIPKEICEMLYDYSKSLDLDVVYVPNHVCFVENVDWEENFIATPINFTIFHKKEFFNKNINIPNSNYKFGFFDKSLYIEKSINYSNYEENISEILSNIERFETNYLFSILIRYLNNLPLNLRQDAYVLLRKELNTTILNYENQLIYSIILKNKYYLDFFTQYKLENTDYEIYGNRLLDKNYKISVVIPIYNNENIIHRTLMSIENQSFDFEDIEVLMVNDASTDSTLDVINEYVDKYSNFIAIHIKDGSGSAGTPRNIGLRLASAKYVMFLDHDDFFEIDALEKLYEHIIHYDCDIVYGTYALVDNDIPIKFYYPNQKQGFFNSLLENKKSITIPPSIWTKLFKKDFLLKNEILFPTILGEDAIFMSKALKNSEGICYLGNDIICYYNLNENSFTNGLPYTYFVEGFTSEEYLFNLYSDWNQIEYYCLRGNGILDYYLNRFMESELSNNEIKELAPLLYGFCHRLDLLKISPKIERNVIVFNHILKMDFDGLINFKNYTPNGIKVFSKKLLNKINSHRFW